ncbi:uncharacterized [Tachysurus ichikawai]
MSGNYSKITVTTKSWHVQGHKHGDMACLHPDFTVIIAVTIDTVICTEDIFSILDYAEFSSPPISAFAHSVMKILR